MRGVCPQRDPVSPGGGWDTHWAVAFSGWAQILSPVDEAGTGIKGSGGRCWGSQYGVSVRGSKRA